MGDARGSRLHGERRDQSNERPIDTLEFENIGAPPGLERTTDPDSSTLCNPSQVDDDTFALALATKTVSQTYASDKIETAYLAYLTGWRFFPAVVLALGLAGIWVNAVFQRGWWSPKSPYGLLPSTPFIVTAAVVNTLYAAFTYVFSCRRADRFRVAGIAKRARFLRQSESLSSLALGLAALWPFAFLYAESRCPAPMEVECLTWSYSILSRIAAGVLLMPGLRAVTALPHLALLLVCLLLRPTMLDYSSQPAGAELAFYVASAVTLLLIVLGVAVKDLTRRRQFEEQLQKRRVANCIAFHQGRMRDLVSTILPDQTLETLRAGQLNVDRRRFCTVVVSGIADYAQWCTGHLPRFGIEVVDGLYRLYDRLLDLLKVEKLLVTEYLYIAGVGVRRESPPGEVHRQVDAAIRFAMAQRRVARRLKAVSPDFEISAGVCSGEAVGTFMGLRRWNYVVLGFAVDGALGLARTSVAGEIALALDTVAVWDALDAELGPTRTIPLPSGGLVDGCPLLSDSHEHRMRPASSTSSSRSGFGFSASRTVHPPPSIPKSDRDLPVSPTVPDDRSLLDEQINVLAAESGGWTAIATTPPRLDDLGPVDLDDSAPQALPTALEQRGFGPWRAFVDPAVEKAYWEHQERTAWNSARHFENAAYITLCAIMAVGALAELRTGVSYLSETALALGISAFRWVVSPRIPRFIDFGLQLLILLHCAISSARLSMSGFRELQAVHGVMGVALWAGSGRTRSMWSMAGLSAIYGVGLYFQRQLPSDTNISTVAIMTPLFWYAFWVVEVTNREVFANEYERWQLERELGKQLLWHRALLHCLIPAFVVDHVARKCVGASCVTTFHNDCVVMDLRVNTMIGQYPEANVAAARMAYHRIEKAVRAAVNGQLIGIMYAFGDTMRLSGPMLQPAVPDSPDLYRSAATAQQLFRFPVVACSDESIACICALLNALERILSAAEGTVASLGALSAVLVSESGYGAVMGETQPSFVVGGVASRTASALIDAAVAGFVGITARVKKHIWYDSSPECLRLQSALKLGTRQIWRVRGLGEAEMLPLAFGTTASAPPQA